MLYCVVYELIVLVYALDILYKFLKVLLLLLRCVLSPTISEDTRLYSAVAILNSSNASLYWSVNPPALFTSFDNDAMVNKLLAIKLSSALIWSSIDDVKLFSCAAVRVVIASNDVILALAIMYFRLDKLISDGVEGIANVDI